jgi:hypothetical protein
MSGIENGETGTVDENLSPESELVVNAIEESLSQKNEDGVGRRVILTKENSNKKVPFLISLYMDEMKELNSKEQFDYIINKAISELMKSDEITQKLRDIGINL